MNWVEACDALNSGGRVRRRIWNDAYLSMHAAVAAEHPEAHLPAPKSIVMRTEEGTLLIGFAPPQFDMDAADWVVCA